VETLIGFAVGYLVGTRQGRDGLAKLRETVLAISRSPEVHQLLRDGVAVAGGAARQVVTGGGGRLLSSTVDALSRNMPRGN
jgi:hypothetical protein